MRKARQTTPEERLEIVQDCLANDKNYGAMALKYNCSYQQVRNWVLRYEKMGSAGLEDRRGRRAGTQPARTPEERLEIVQDCLANDKNYGAMALKYNCSYQQIRNWVLRYEKMGSAGLEDRRGRRAGTQPARTPEEELRDKIAELEQRNRDLQMENDLLKKVRELEMKDRYL